MDMQLHCSNVTTLTADRCHFPRLAIFVTVLSPNVVANVPRSSVSARNLLCALRLRPATREDRAVAAEWQFQPRRRMACLISDSNTLCLHISDVLTPGGRYIAKFRVVFCGRPCSLGLTCWPLSRCKGQDQTRQRQADGLLGGDASAKEDLS